jgi:hemolysin III
MGWFALIPLAELTRRLGAAAIVLILAGGACYTAGMVMYATRRPRLFPRVFSYHEVFHLLVIAGATFHFAVVLSHVLPYPG